VAGVFDTCIFVATSIGVSFEFNQKDCEASKPMLIKQALTFRGEGWDISSRFGAK
jgi:hypothetical protein